MTDITVYLEDDVACCRYLKIEAKGHANYSKHGTDIVCAALSTALQYGARLIDRFSDNFDYKAHEKDGIITLSLPEGHSYNDSVFKVCDELESVLRQIAEQYPEYVRVDVKYITREELNGV